MYVYIRKHTIRTLFKEGLSPGLGHWRTHFVVLCAQHVCIYTYELCIHATCRKFFASFSYFNYEIFRDFIYRLIVYVCILVHQTYITKFMLLLYRETTLLRIATFKRIFLSEHFYLISLSIRWFLFIWRKTWLKLAEILCNMNNLNYKIR